jgi:hypothetical protein
MIKGIKKMIIDNLKSFKNIQAIDNLDLLAFSVIMKKHYSLIMNECKSNLRLRQIITKKLNKLNDHAGLNPIYLQYEV